MNMISTWFTASTDQVYRMLTAGAGHCRAVAGEQPDAGDAEAAIDAGAGDRGAVSLEQVLWFVAAGVSVAVIAAILWGQIRSQAETPVQAPTAP